jgi:hypothetical protein
MSNRISIFFNNIINNITSIFIEKDIMCSEEFCNNIDHVNFITFYCKRCNNCNSAKIVKNRITESIPSFSQITCILCRHVFYFTNDENTRKCKFIGPLRTDEMMKNYIINFGKREYFI